METYSEQSESLPKRILHENREVHALEGPLYLSRHPEQTNFYQSKILKRTVDRVCSELGRPGGTILDAGCGTGYLFLELLRRGFSVTGVDLSDAMLKALEAQLLDSERSRARLQAQDIESFLTTDSAQYDVVTASALLHHLYDPSDVLARLSERVKPGGLLLIFFEPLKQAIASPWRYRLHRMLTHAHESVYRMEMALRGISLFEEKYELADYQRKFGGIDPYEMAELLKAKDWNILEIEKYCSRRYGLAAWIANRWLKSENTFNLLARK
ncbi:MAG: class I SAM-dependent methyltransferase [Candidatus Nitrohelix vancouverensis]|uniref:Class I SAM-dependent methyltransferase n=1 Tax=Candidatus Nitrohelix vancouverensis TaxID=2705534 RepID=A0A7T0G348_9BACT|nr:MAG: class I SAM-dependent methyltransferase [Candidatus Nitrohelix vancouverensis]